MTIESFTAALRQFSDVTVPKAFKAANASLLTRMMSDIVNGTPDSLPGTPIDTGQARSNWFPSIGTPSSDVMEFGFDSFSVGEYFRAGGMHAHHSSGPKKVRVTSAQAYAFSMDRLPEIIAAMPVYGVTYITNNIHYIWDLNDGSSKQAPAAFVQAAVIRAGNAYAEGGNLGAKAP